MGWAGVGRLLTKYAVVSEFSELVVSQLPVCHFFLFTAVIGLLLIRFLPILDR